MAQVILTREAEGSVGSWHHDGERMAVATVWFDHYPETPDRPYLATIDYTGAELCDTRPAEARERVAQMAKDLPVLNEVIAAAEAWERDGTLPTVAQEGQ